MWLWIRPWAPCFDYLFFINVFLCLVLFLVNVIESEKKIHLIYFMRIKVQKLELS